MNTNTAILVTYGLSRAYGNSLALDGVTMSVHRGDIYGLVGRNGAGKTTLMRQITGQSRPTAGELELFGVSGRSLEAQRARIGAMIEVPSFSPFLSARENLEYYRLQRGIPGQKVVDQVLEETGLGQAGRKKFKSFSLGMKQRLGLALALMNRPDFLVLDEPINGLDPEGVAEFRELLLRLNRERQATILISSHILSELSTVATRYGFLEKGRLLEEIGAQELREKCRTCLRLTVDDAPRAAAALQTRLGTDKLEVLPGGVIQLYDCLDDPKAVSFALAEDHVALLAMEQRGADLEDYFLELIGGGRHA